MYPRFSASGVPMDNYGKDSALKRTLKGQVINEPVKHVKLTQITDFVELSATPSFKPPLEAEMVVDIKENTVASNPVYNQMNIAFAELQSTNYKDIKTDNGNSVQNSLVQQEHSDTQSVEDLPMIITEDSSDED